MIVAIFNIYLVLLFALVKLRIVPFNLLWKVSPALVLVLLLFGLFIPMGWGAPEGKALVIRQSVPIVADVAGEVIDVPVEANTPIKAGDVLFRLDPTPYRAQVDALAAQLRFEELRLKQMTELERTQAGRVFDVQQREASVEQLRAQLVGAQWNLDKTVVRAPTDGYVTNLALRKGARVGNLPMAPVMAFIDTSDTVVGVEVAQNDSRFIAPGQAVEIAFKFLPGRIQKGRVEAVLQAVSTGQVQASGLAVTPGPIQAVPFVVRVKLDDPALLRSLPAGSVGDAAIFTAHVTSTHVIRKVLLRQIAILNYVLP
ncbi:MAG: HlyD family secretion protein [Reyranella sp.]|uniref:HlyD family secretion protein n=1 Tax=Reyranella sp. TaxID=1929291 RepID=UPI00095BD790|nr:efflux RND transporter periplasmic adaptor subunit [Reyranella sp.]MBR2813636.1 HlyD family secretion protein [Reyranella sp.]OJU38629.1 MAG: efflux transporter periplasmic adaptor subunit [Alphaproteobacteria bacterium 65-37]